MDTTPGSVIRIDLVTYQEKFEDSKRGNQMPYIDGQTIQWPKEK